MAEQIISKRCSTCKEIKQLSDFNRNRTTKDGLQKYCKSCKKIIQRKYRKTPKGKVAYYKAHKKYYNTEKGKIVIQAIQKHYKTRHPNYAKAHRVVNNAITAGKLPRPDSLQCYYCPNRAKQYHHWHGYEPEHWLDVIPVCIKCHRKCHRKAS